MHLFCISLKLKRNETRVQLEAWQTLEMMDLGDGFALGWTTSSSPPPGRLLAQSWNVIIHKAEVGQL